MFDAYKDQICGSFSKNADAPTDARPVRPLYLLPEARGANILCYSRGNLGWHNVGYSGFLSEQLCGCSTPPNVIERVSCAL
jgi:hypothetical protein